jgi:putative ATPase
MRFILLQSSRSGCTKYGGALCSHALAQCPTKLMEEIGYSKGYKYAHDYEAGVVTDMKCLPRELEGRKYYQPTKRGFEGKIAKAMDL